MAEQQQQGGGEGVAIGVLGGMLYMMLGFFYEQQKEIINMVFIWLNIVEIAPFTFISDLAAEAFDILREKSLAPGQLDAEDIKKMLRFVGGYIAYPVAVLGLWLGYKAWFMTPVEDLRSKYDLMTLLEANAKVHPWMKPVSGRNILDEPLLSGNWRVAMQPIGFVATHGLLRGQDGRRIPEHLLINTETGLADELSPFLENNIYNWLDESGASKVFMGQMGPTFKAVGKWLEGRGEAPAHKGLFVDAPGDAPGRMNVELLTGLEDYKAGLVGAFMSMGCGNKKEGRALLDHMSKTFVEGRTITKKSRFLKREKKIVVDEVIDIFDVPASPSAHELIAKHANDQRLLRKSVPHSAYISTWMQFLLTFAREKGVIGTADFIWLKTVNRTLFYALHQAGGRAAWCEAAGPWAHYIEEEIAGPLEKPAVSGAVAGLEQALLETGWLPK